MNRRDLKAERTELREYASPTGLGIVIHVPGGFRYADDPEDEAVIQSVINYVNEALNAYATQIEQRKKTDGSNT